MWERRHDLDGSWVATVRFQELSDGGVPSSPFAPVFATWTTVEADHGAPRGSFSPPAWQRDRGPL